MARILLVDDDPDTLHVVAHMLESGGHSVVRGTAGAAIWDSLRHAAFDLVVTDLNMPSLDGVGLARWVRQHRPGIPVIAISGHLGTLSQLEGHIPFHATIAKPLRRDTLLATVERTIGSRDDSPQPNGAAPCSL
jgi:two-component system, cell cycle sensor histidine kinase and response regulator CckA